MRPSEVLTVIIGTGLVVGVVFMFLGFLLIPAVDPFLAVPLLVSGALFLLVSGVLIPGLRAFDSWTTGR